MILIAGPCVIEGEEHTLKTAKTIQAMVQKQNLQRWNLTKDISFYFKASWDKANRTSPGSYRGVGINTGMEILREVKRKVECKITTDIHEPWQAWGRGITRDAVDLIQIPALLCRQTDLLHEAGRSGKPVNVKRAPSVTAEQMWGAAEKLAVAGCTDIMLTERGTGCGDLAVDFRNLKKLRGGGIQVRVIFDASHSATSREYVAPLARAAVAFGVDGIFVEVHDDPDDALCDGHTSITPAALAELLPELLRIERGL